MTPLADAPALVVPAVARSLLAPAFLAVVAAAAVATLLLYAERPRLSRRAVVALVPWMVVGAALSVLASVASYPALVRPAVDGVGAYLTTYAVVCLVWFAILQFARGDRSRGALPNYIGSMGLGAAIVVVSVVLLSAGHIGDNRVFWLFITPVTALVAAGLVLVLLGLWYTEAAAYTGMVGGLVVFGHALAAIATALAVVDYGAAGHTLLSWAVLNLLSAVEAAAVVGLDEQLVWAWGFVWTRLAIATAVIVALSSYTHRHPNRGNLVLGLFAAVGVVGGVTALLTIAVGG